MENMTNPKALMSATDEMQVYHALHDKLDEMISNGKITYQMVGDDMEFISQALVMAGFLAQQKSLRTPRTMFDDEELSQWSGIVEIRGVSRNRDNPEETTVVPYNQADYFSLHLKMKDGSEKWHSDHQSMDQVEYWISRLNDQAKLAHLHLEIKKPFVVSYMVGSEKVAVPVMTATSDEAKRDADAILRNEISVFLRSEIPPQSLDDLIQSGKSRQVTIGDYFDHLHRVSELYVKAFDLSESIHRPHIDYLVQETAESEVVEINNGSIVDKIQFLTERNGLLSLSRTLNEIDPDEEPGELFMMGM